MEQYDIDALSNIMQFFAFLHPITTTTSKPWIHDIPITSPKELLEFRMTGCLKKAICCPILNLRRSCILVIGALSPSRTARQAMGMISSAINVKKLSCWMPLTSKTILATTVFVYCM